MVSINKNIYESQPELKNINSFDNQVKIFEVKSDSQSKEVGKFESIKIVKKKAQTKSSSPVAK